jgi:glycerol-3-phosphate acyltransferase PlsY
MGLGFDLGGILVAYLLGSIPFAVLVAKFSGLGDITKMGSGNPGATNITRQGGKKMGAITLALDSAKGFIAAYFWGVPGALAVVIGHCFSVFLKFKGGKGVATTLGAYFGLSLQFGLLASGFWLIGYGLFGISSVAALISVNLIMFISPFYFPSYKEMAVFLSILVTWKHNSNIKKLFMGTEN